MRPARAMGILFGLAMSAQPAAAAIATEIPEPSSAAMLGGALIAGGVFVSILTVVRRRRSRRESRRVETPSSPSGR